MPTKEELQALNPVNLSVMCRKVAESPSFDDATREKARKHISDWTRLQKTPNPDLKEQRKLEAEQEAQKQRMVEFLMTGLP